MHLLVLVGISWSVVVGWDVVPEPPVTVGLIFRRDRLTLITRYLGERLPEDSVN
jgi:hypothetical protein